MDNNDIGDLKHFQPAPNLKPDKITPPHVKPEQAASQSAYTSSSIQKSSAEAIVLTYASGFPVLQPPPKTQVKNIYEATTYSVGSTAQAGPIAAPMEGLSKLPAYLEGAKEISNKNKPNVSLEDVIDFVRKLLAIITAETEQIEQERAVGDQSLKLMLSTMALEMLYLSIYGSMSGEEFKSLLHEKVDLPANAQPLASSLITFIKSRLPIEAKTYNEVMSKLIDSINTHPSLTSLFKRAEYLSQAIVNGTSFDIATSSRGIDDFINSLGEVEQTKETIITTIWQNYDQNLKEFSQRMHNSDIQTWIQEVKGKEIKSSTEYYAFILAQSAVRQPDGKIPLVEQFSSAFNHWVLNPHKQVSEANNTQEYPSSSFIAGSMMAGVDIVRDAIKSTINIFQHQLHDSPLADVLFAVVPGITLTPDYQSAAALIVALLNNGAIYKATEDALKKGKEKNIPPKDLDFAIKYAKQVIAIVTHKITNESPQNKEIQERDRLVRLMLTVMAMNMLYRAAYGGMTGLEFGTILKGETADIHEKIKPLIEQLAHLIKNNLPATEQARQDTILRLMDYVDSKDSIDSMLQSTRILANLLSTRDIDQKHWEVQSS